jgi:plastocyanin
MKRTAILFIVTLGLVLTGTAAPAATVEVTIGDFFFTPTPLTINPGDTVRWTNTGSLAHTSTSGTGCTPDGSWNSATLSSGESFSHLFATPGTFPYYCSFHCSSMAGSITVNTVPPPAPLTPVIEANNTGTALTIGASTPLTISASLDPGGSAGTNADWWVAAETPFGFYHLLIGPTPWQWEPELITTYQGPAVSIAETVVLDSFILPPGNYTFYFGLDTVVDGLVTFDQLIYDSIAVTVTP